MLHEKKNKKQGKKINKTNNIICLSRLFCIFCIDLNWQVEMLYQRYFLRMNQSNTTHILGLLLALVLSLAAMHIILIPMESTSFYHKQTVQRNRYNDVVKGNHSHGNHHSNNNSAATLNSIGQANNITNENNNSNSSWNQYFARFNYNYTTDSETGKMFICLLSIYQKYFFFNITHPK